MREVAGSINLMDHATAALTNRAEAWGSYFGIAGCLLLACAIPSSRFGWFLFLASNAGWLIFAGVHRYRRMFIQNCIYTASSLLGIANAFYPGNAFQRAVTGLLA